MTAKISWFPGHMAQTLRSIDKELKLCDLIIYMLDARAPKSCFNPEYEKFCERKPTLFVVNKVDLVDRAELKEFNKPNYILKNSTRNFSSKQVLDKVNEILAEKIARQRAKGISPILRAVVIGVTNSGKSTFINSMANKAKTLTGNKAGVTRTKQWVAVSDNFWLLDMPGTLYPNLENARVAQNLAYIGAIKDDILDIVSLSKDLLLDLIKINAGSVANRFGIKETLNADEMFSQIALKRGCVARGKVDEIRTARLILDDYRSGKITKKCLDALI
ncbi:MAG: ribosome biogenesis GTPase YlqF [Christensenellaceae bacterium]|nr:ribosome biogenesis GTPase YlqF [Christensenellaceae bacterium]